MVRKKRRVSDPDNPPLTKAFFAKARPMAEVFPEIVASPPKIGRPRVEKPKALISLRIDQDVLAAYRRTGAGWQKLAQAALAKGAPKTGKTQVRSKAR